MPDMINPQKGIDLMNNTSIINRILFAVTIFQQRHANRMWMLELCNVRCVSNILVWLEYVMEHFDKSMIYLES